MGGTGVLRAVAGTVIAGAAVAAKTVTASSPPALCGRVPFLNVEERSSDLEDWSHLPEIDEDWTDQRTVFAPTPTLEEVEAATEDLHAVLDFALPSPDIEKHISSPDTVESKDNEEVLDVCQKPSSSLTSLKLLAVGGSSVYYAFRLWQTNPQVQDVVKSLAHDPAVWTAVSKNKKVADLLQNMHEQNAIANYELINDLKNEEDFLFGSASRIWDHVLAAILQILGKAEDIISFLFGSVEKAFLKGVDAPADKIVASCLMLAFAILIIVIIKRTGV